MGVKKLIALLTLASGGFLTASAEVEWLSTEYNFGAFKEADGEVTGRVRLVNHGPEATWINRVRPSCGCTSASYTKEMIQPGDTAIVSFTYNPKGRPGTFDKTVKVYMGADNDLTVLHIRGTVIGSATTLKNNFPVEAGPLRLENTLVSAGEIRRGASRHLFLNLYNQGNDTLRPVLKSPSEALEVVVTPAEIPPGEMATLTFLLKTADESLDGPHDYEVDILADREGYDKTSVIVNVVIVPDTRAISLEELENSPQAFLFPEYIDLGENVLSGDMNIEFSVLNEGKTPLEVKRVYSRDEAVYISRVPEKVSPGEGGKVKGKLRAGKIAEGPFRLKVEVITDDPLHPLRTCNIVGVK